MDMGIEVDEWIQENRNYLANKRRSSIFPDSHELMAGHNNQKSNKKLIKSQRGS